MDSNKDSRLDIKSNPFVPDFFLIGAMKSGTTSLFDYLADQDEICCSDPKEPNFFSDDEIYDNGYNWYENRYAVPMGRICGDASTHYTKLPTYPDTVRRMTQHGVSSETKFIYMIRNPIKRLISQYLHEWTVGKISRDIDAAVAMHPELVTYSQYHYQLTPYIQEFGASSIMVVCFENFISNPKTTVETVMKFLGCEKKPIFSIENTKSNSSEVRFRQFPLYGTLVDSRLMTNLRRTLIPKSFREKVRHSLQFKGSVDLSEDSLRFIAKEVEPDLVKLGERLGINLGLETYDELSKKLTPRVLMSD